MEIILREYGSIIRQKTGWFLLVVAGIAGGAGLEIAVPLFYKNIANELTLPFSAATENLLLQNLFYIALMYAAIWLSWRALELGMIMFQSWGLNYLDKRCFEVLVRQRYPFFEKNFAGSLVKQANRFIKAFETIIDWLIFQFLGNLLAISMAFIIFYQQQPQFALYFLIWVALFIGWSAGYLVWKLKFDMRVAEMDSRLGGAYSDSVANIFIVKSFALEQQERLNISNLANESYEKRNVAWLLMFVSFAVQGLLAFGIELLLVYLLIRKWRAGNFAIGEFVLFQSVLLILIRHLWDFGRDFRRFFTALADAREMADVFQQADIEQDAPDTQAHSIQQGDILFEDIGFAYGGTDLFKHFNLHIQPEEKVALVGHSGSGKTSLTKLLFRFVEQQQGRILFDGWDAQTFTLPSLRSQISLVPQQPELFHRSIRDNIVLGKNIVTVHTPYQQPLNLRHSPDAPAAQRPQPQTA
jgi:ATP-binding cassette subfamily B protein